MIPPPLTFVLLLSTAAVAQEIPRAIQVAEPPLSKAIRDPNVIVSNSEQFRVSGGVASDRSAVALLAEEAKSDLLKLTDEKDEFVHANVPIDIVLHGKNGDPMPPRIEAIALTWSELGYKVTLDLHMGLGVEPERVRRAATSALLYYRTLKDLPKGADTPFLVPPWLVDGLREATDWRLGRSDRRLYEALFKSSGLFKLDELFSINPAACAELDPAMRAAFRVSSGSLAMALLEQPQGKDGFRSFLTEVAGFQGEMPVLLRKHFPGLNLSENSLAKWWALQFANIGGRNPATDVMNVAATEIALNEALQLDFRTPEGTVERKNLFAWPEAAALPEAARAAAIQPAVEALVRISWRCFPTYRPLVADYNAALAEIGAGRSDGIAAQLEDLASRRNVLAAKAARARDYLDWFEITRASESSGAFEDFMRLKERLKENPRRRDDPLSQYLDRMDAVFDRGFTDLAPVAPQSGELDFSSLPPLPLPQ